MESKLTLDPAVILKTYKDVGDYETFTQIMVGAAYYVKYHGRLPSKFNEDEHPIAYGYFVNRIQPLIDGKTSTETNITEPEQQELFGLIDASSLFDNEEKNVLKNMLELWWGRGKYSRTELIYTQSMAQTRSGISGEKFAELRRWLKAEECLTWENRPYNDYLTSYHMFNEAKLLAVLRAENDTAKTSKP